MSNEKQDLINHRLTATACKNYTDKEIKKAKDELKTFFSKNTVDTIDHTNELAYQITAPAGAKLLQLQAIGGNSVKYEPSAASDDTTALIKTMPSVVYDFDVNKVKGVSEVSENLIVFDSTYNLNNCTYTYNDGKLVITITDPTLSAYCRLKIKPISVVANNSYAINLFPVNIDSASVSAVYIGNENKLDKVVIGSQNDGYATRTITATDTEEFDILYFYYNATTQINSFTFTPMLVKGSTAPTEFKVGYTGIHNNELAGFKVEGANLVDIPNTTNNTISFTDNIGDTWFGRVWESPYSKLIASISNKFSDGNYDTTFTLDKDTKIRIQLGQASVGRWNKDILLKKGTYTISLTFKATSTAVTFSYIMINYGSNALPYADYITPTTIPIDLTSIVDSSGNKLFADGSLKGINDVYDEITPYKAVKRFGIVDLGSLTWSYDSTYNIFWVGIINISPRTSVLCANYTSNIVRNDLMNDKEISTVPSYATNMVMIKDSNYTTTEAFKTAMNGVYLVYELATPIEADIDLSQLKSIQGHSNGSITAQNTYDMPVPSEIRYNSIIQDTLCPSVSVEGANKLGNHNLALFGNNRYILTTQNVLILPNTTYTFSNSISNGADGSISILDESLSVIQTISQSTTNKRLATFTTLSNAKYFKIDRWYIDNTTFTIESAEVMLNVGSIALPYRPYKETITRLLPNSETKYGWGINADVHNLRVFSDYEGELVGEGQLEVDNVDLGTLTWDYQSGSFRTTISNIVLSRTTALLSKMYNICIGQYWSDMQNMDIAKLSADAQLRIINNNYDNIRDFKNGNSGIELYYLKNATDTETLDSFDYFFDVEEGDTITFNNPYAQQVYATYSFITKEVKSNE